MQTISRWTAGPIGPILASALGLAFAAWLYPIAVFDPLRHEWLLYSDAAQHFFGWQFFRAEPWQFPPGRLVGYGLEMGSSIVFTDSIPLLALLLKPFSGSLPPEFQYTGLWVAACHAAAPLFAWRCGALATGRVEAAIGCALFALRSSCCGSEGTSR